jgi:hypothetical protein
MPARYSYGSKRVVERRHEHVVHVEQETAVGILGHAREELPLAHRGALEFHVRTGVFEHERPLEHVLHFADARDDVAQAFLGVRQRQQVVQVAARDAGPAQMVRHPVRLRRARQFLQVARYARIEGIGAADRERHAVHDDRIARGDLFAGTKPDVRRRP